LQVVRINFHQGKAGGAQDLTTLAESAGYLRTLWLVGTLPHLAR